MERWLDNFDYRIHVSVLSVLMPVVLLGAVIVLTVFLKVWGSMRENIVEELRYE
ncbi:MAG: hypothetical protein H6559_21440 [Lewinellaceae bacterium]|nr:hypothetical protein [Lewinellaceae bacterium]